MTTKRKKKKPEEKPANNFAVVPTFYNDGSCSREIQDDYLDHFAGNPEGLPMRFYSLDKFNQSMPPTHSIYNLLEKMNAVKKLIQVCRESLTQSHLMDIKSIVATVLESCVENQIKALQEELSEICIRLK